MPWWSVVTLVTTLKNYFKNIQLFGIFPLFENKSCIKRKTVPEKHTGQIENIKVSIVDINCLFSSIEGLFRAEDEN